jgi:hypothetical protein
MKKSLLVGALVLSISSFLWFPHLADGVTEGLKAKRTRKPLPTYTRTPTPEPTPTQTVLPIPSRTPTTTD